MKRRWQLLVAVALAAAVGSADGQIRPAAAQAGPDPASLAVARDLALEGHAVRVELMFRIRPATLSDPPYLKKAFMGASAICCIVMPVRRPAIPGSSRDRIETRNATRTRPIS